MALLKYKDGALPDDAVVLSEMEALKYQMDVVRKWDKTSDVFALRYGSYILGGAALFSAAFFNNHFRRMLMLGRYGLFSSYLPVCFIPSCASALLHSELILRKVILFEECAICTEIKAAALQATLGAVYPVVVAPLGCAALAIRYATYDVPHLFQQHRATLELFRNIFNKIKTKTFYLFVAQAFLGSVVTYFEASNLINISKKMAARDELINN